MIQIKSLLIILGLVIFSLPVVIFFSNEGTSDMGVWLDWSSHINRWGPLNAYSIIHTNPDYERTDYPPISFINLWFALKMAAVGNVSWIIGIKLLILIYYLTTWVALIYLATLVTKRSILTNVAIASGLFLGGMYFVINSVALSYLDITYAPFVVFSLALFARKKYLFSGACFALAVLIKWMPMIILPVFLLYFINLRGQRFQVDRLGMFKFFKGLILIISSLIVVFLLNNLSFFSFVESLSKAFNRWPSLSHALNFNWIVLYLVKQINPETYLNVIRNNYYIFQLISATIFLSVGFLILKSFIKKTKDMSSLLQTSLLISWSYYIWRTGVHENHLYITVLTALCLAILYTNWGNIRLYLWLSLIGLAQAVIFFGILFGNVFIRIPNSFATVWGVHVNALLAALHVLIYLVYLKKYLHGKTF